MNGHALHLAINHFPIVLAVVAAGAALVAFVTRRRAVLLYAMTSLLLASVSGYPALLTGERAEDAIENRWFVEHETVEAHERAAERATWILLASGVVCAGCLYLVMRSPREATPGMLILGVVLVLAVSSAVAVGWTGWKGGFIVSKNARLEGSSSKPDSASASHDGH